MVDFLQLFSPKMDEFHFVCIGYPITGEPMIEAIYRPHNRLRFQFYGLFRLVELIAVIPTIEKEGKFCFFKRSIANTIAGDEATKFVKWLKTL